MNDATSIWERASGGFSGEDGDQQVAILQEFHDSAMNSGLTNAVLDNDEELVHEAVEAYRWFGLDDAAALIVSVQKALDADEDPDRLVATKDGDFYDLIPDDETVIDAVARALKAEPSAFAPVG